MERVSLCKAACSCAKRGLIIRNLAEIPIGSCAFHSISSLTAGSEHGTNYTKNPPFPNLLPGNTGMATGMQPRQVDLVHSLHYIKKKKRKRKKKKKLLNWFPFWKFENIFSSNYSGWQKLIFLRKKEGLTEVCHLSYAVMKSSLITSNEPLLANTTRSFKWSTPYGIHDRREKKQHSNGSVNRREGGAWAINLLISTLGGGQQHQSVGYAPPKHYSNSVLIGHTAPLPHY